MFNFIKKRKKKEEYIYLDPELDIEAEFDRRRDSERNDRDFDEIKAPVCQDTVRTYDRIIQLY